MLRIDFFNILFTIINLIVLYLLMKKFLVKPVTAIMDKRKAFIEEQLTNAAETEKAANTLKEQYEDTMKNAEEESIQIVEAARMKAKEEYERIVGEADTKAGKIIQNAEKTIDIEKEKTLRAMESEIASLAMVAAAKIIGENSNANSNQSLYNEFITKAGDANDSNSN